jgi:excisionase family DNA binding protein
MFCSERMLIMKLRRLATTPLVEWKPTMTKQPLTGAEPLLMPAAVAEIFRVDAKTVTRWAKAGRITSIRALGGHHRFRESEIREALKDGPSSGLRRSAVSPWRNRSCQTCAEQDHQTGGQRWRCSPPFFRSTSTEEGLAGDAKPRA